MIQLIEEYVLSHLKKHVWDRFPNQLAALASAERLIGLLPLTGEIDDEDYKIAAFEIAIAFADGIDPEKEYRLLSQQTHGYGPMRQQKNTEMVEEYLAYGIPSLTAWQILAPYIQRPTTVALERTS